MLGRSAFHLDGVHAGEMGGGDYTGRDLQDFIIDGYIDKIDLVSLAWAFDAGGN
jgi:hypothetical protein